MSVFLACICVSVWVVQNFLCAWYKSYCETCVLNFSFRSHFFSFFYFVVVSFHSRANCSAAAHRIIKFSIS